MPCRPQALVKFVAGADPAAKGRALAKGQAQEAEVVSSHPGGQWVLVKFAAGAGASTAKAAAKIAEDDAVEAVEVTYRVAAAVLGGGCRGRAARDCMQPGCTHPPCRERLPTTSKLPASLLCSCTALLPQLCCLHRLPSPVLPR